MWLNASTRQRGQAVSLLSSAKSFATCVFRSSCFSEANAEYHVLCLRSQRCALQRAPFAVQLFDRGKEWVTTEEALPLPSQPFLTAYMTVWALEIVQLFFYLRKNNVFYGECGSCSSFVLSKFAVKFQVLALAALVLGVTWTMRKMDDRGRLVFHDPFWGNDP